jgi:putative DNA primase/helicase
MNAPDLMTVQSALSFVPANCSREVWVNIGNALKREFGAAGLDVWLDWSADDAAFNRKTAMQVWKSLKRLVVPIGFVFKEAKLFGFEFEKQAYQAPSAEVLAQRKADREAAEQRELAQAQRDKESAKAYSQRLWSEAEKHGKSPYLVKKGVEGEACRYLNGTLLVPMLDYAQEPAEFVGVQRIKPDGAKLFPKGVAKSGSACRLGAFKGGLALLCEGYATGLSLRMAVQHKLPVLVTFDVGNMVKVLHMMREKHPDWVLLVCADNDQKTKGNPGIRLAKKAIKGLASVDVIYPNFAVADRESSDFNDLHASKGLEAVRRQLKPVLTHYGHAEAVNHG